MRILIFLLTADIRIRIIYPENFPLHFYGATDLAMRSNSNRRQHQCIMTFFNRSFIAEENLEENYEEYADENFVPYSEEYDNNDATGMVGSDMYYPESMLNEGIDYEDDPDANYNVSTCSFVYSLLELSITLMHHVLDEHGAQHCRSDHDQRETSPSKDCTGTQ